MNIPLKRDTVQVQKVPVVEEVDCTVNSLLTDTSLKRTPRIGPFLSLLLFDSLQNGLLSKTDA